MASDIELANRIRAGEKAALAELYERYLPVLWRYAFAQLRPDEAAARDAVSETFLAAMRALAKSGHNPAKGSVIAWLTGIARHKITDVRRARQPLPAAAANASAEIEPTMALQQEEMRNAVTTIMLALDDDERLALEWKYFEGTPVRVIADRLGKTEKAAEALLFRAREGFRRQSRHLLDFKGDYK